MTIPFLPATPHNWPFPPAETLWLTALLAMLFIAKLRLPP